jgi:hypothetical protein
MNTELIRVSVILPVMDETTSMQETTRILLEENRGSLQEILVVVCQRTTPQAMEVCQQLAAAEPGLIRIVQQGRPFLGGAVRDCFDWAVGTHVLMMASDLETDPTTVKDLIATARQGFDVVTATRWSLGWGFQGYGSLRGVANWIFQQLIRILYATHLSDLTYGFRLLRTSLVQHIEWEELKHPFLLETILKPLRLGCSVTEISTRWRRRSEGESHNKFWQNFVYLRTAVRTRLKSKSSLLRKVAYESNLGYRWLRFRRQTSD